MRGLEMWVPGYLLNALWQIPLVLAAAWIAARLARSAGARMEHRVWAGALLAEMVLPLCPFRPGDFRSVLWLWNSNAGRGMVRVLAGPGVVHGSGRLPLPGWVLAGLVAAYGSSLLYFTGRFLWGAWMTAVMRGQAAPLKLTTDAEQKMERICRLLNIGLDTVRIAESGVVAGPVTVGVRRKVVLLPAGFIDTAGAGDLEAVLAHELAHVRRWDFAKNLLYEAVSLPMAWHPAVWLTRSRLAETREMVCDAMAAEIVTGREKYARALLRLAAMLSDRLPARTLHAIGILDANALERRIMKLTRKHAEIQGLRRFAIVAACGMVAMAACGTALALRMNVAVPGNGMTTAQDEEEKPLHVKIGYLKKISGDDPVYPKLAKAAHVTGTVILQAVISKEGEVENLQVIDGPSMLCASSIEAVKTWRYEPYLLNGEPVEVETTVNEM